VIGGDVTGFVKQSRNWITLEQIENLKRKKKELEKRLREAVTLCEDGTRDTMQRRCRVLIVG
jgi:hypothetical protein